MYHVLCVQDFDRIYGDRDTNEKPTTDENRDVHVSLSHHNQLAYI